MSCWWDENNFSFYLHSISIFSRWLIANNYALKSFNFFLSRARDVWKVSARMHIKSFTMQKKIARSSFPINRKLILLSISSSSSLMDFNGGYGHKKASDEQQWEWIELHSCSETFYFIDEWKSFFVDAHTAKEGKKFYFVMRMLN